MLCHWRKQDSNAWQIINKYFWKNLAKIKLTEEE